MKKLLKRSRSLAFAPFVFLMAACSSNAYLAHSGHRAFDNANYNEAITSFAKSAESSSSNQLLFKLDLAMSFFEKRDYKAAIEKFLEAEKLAEIKDYTSVSEEVGVLLTGQDVRGYKGEDFEKVLINVYLALSYAAIGELEDARVECRKINDLLRRMIIEGKRNYQESAFARYLSAMLWEASGEWNSAYIDYKKAYELDPKMPGIVSSLIYTAKLSGLREAEQEWRIQFPSANLIKPSRSSGELVVFFERGKSPRKQARYDDQTLPRFVSRQGGGVDASLVVDGEARGGFQEFLDIDQTSKDYLEDRISRMRAAKLARVAVKAALAGIAAKSSDNDDLGLITFWLLMSADSADLRSWLSLPGSIEVLRLELPAGPHFIKLLVRDQYGKDPRTIDFGEVEIKSRQKLFLMGR